MNSIEARVARLKALRKEIKLGRKPKPRWMGPDPKWQAHQSARREARRALEQPPQIEPIHYSGEWFTDEFGNPTRTVTHTVHDEDPETLHG